MIRILCAVAPALMRCKCAVAPALVVLLCTAQTALAQPFLPPAPSASPGVASISDALPAAPPRNLPPITGDHCNPDYWIVSSRDCPQKNDGCCPQCEFDVTHVTANGCRIGSEVETLTRSLKPGVPVCILVHGSYVSLSDLRTDGLETYRWIRAAAPHLPLHVIFYTWPSEGRKFPFPTPKIVTMTPHLDVAVLGNRAGYNGFYLSQLLDRIPAEHPLSLVGHSHGARIISTAMHLRAGGCEQELSLGGPLPRPLRRVRLVYIAAGIDHHWLNPNERYGRTLCRSECLVNVRNRRDPVLALYPLRRPFGHRALGRAGFTKRDYRELGALAGKTIELDATKLLGFHHFAGSFYSKPSLATAIAPYLYYSNSQ
ncbi:MAG: hypothetical protein CMJ48_00325 [Planctomycetaceae bacterium]|nr:hypothetical protein [Planctomycetaceae bacterium]